MKRVDLLLLLGMLLVSSCSTFLEKSITGKVVVLDAPASGVALSSYTENFHWEPLSGALTYELQLVVPNFTRSQNFLLDTTISRNAFTYTLVPGSFQWRVRALNGSSETAFTTASFSVDTASFNTQVVVLSAPGTGALVMSPRVTLSWQPLFGASQYRIELDSVASNLLGTSNTPLFTVLTAASSTAYTCPHTGTYYWRVRAENATGVSGYSAVSSFSFATAVLVDSVALLSPAAAQRTALATPILLSWGPILGATSYKLSLFKGDSLTTYPNLVVLPQAARTYAFTAGVTGDRVYWSVSALNAAGVQLAPVAHKRYFTVGP